MTLKAVVSDLESVAENLRELYSKGEDGRFVLNVENPDDLPALAGLKKKNTELIDEKKEIAEKLKKFDGVDLQEIEDLRKRVKEGGDKDVQKVREEYEAKLQQAADNAKTESAQAQQALALANEKAEAAEARAINYYVDGEIARVLTEPATKGSVVLLAPEIKKHLKAEPNGETFKLSVVGKDGHPRIKDGQGNPFTLPDLVVEMKSDDRYARAFDASGADGSGASGGSGGSGSPKVLKREPGVFAANAEAIVKGEKTVSP